MMGYTLGYKTRTPDEVTVEVSGSAIHSDQVLKWREEQFRRMGFVDYIADFLASTRIDLHQMEDLLEKGCPHRTAAEILMGSMWSGEDEHWQWTGEGDYLDREEDQSEAA